MSDFQQNPYAAGVVQKKHVHSEVEAFRHAHLSHEASVKSIGLLYIISGVIGLLVSTGYLLSGIAMLSRNDMPGPVDGVTFGIGLAVAGAVGIAIALAQLVVAFGLRKLAPWTRIPAAIVAGIGLLFFPIGTLINGYVLYLLFSPKGSTVFSPEYQDVIAQTPHIKYKTSIIVWIFVGLLVALLTAGLAAALFAA